LIELGDDGFALTDLGVALIGKLASLDSWANDWADQLARRQQPLIVSNRVERF
jgi:hypothetical protein